MPQRPRLWIFASCPSLLVQSPVNCNNPTKSFQPSDFSQAIKEEKQKFGLFVEGNSNAIRQVTFTLSFCGPKLDDPNSETYVAA